jgi:hypothetical protein
LESYGTILPFPILTYFIKKEQNNNGGMMVAVGKHLKATQTDIIMDNTEKINIDGLSEQVRIIGIYGPIVNFET